MIFRIAAVWALSQTLTAQAAIEWFGDAYARAIHRTAGMADDRKTQNIASTYGLQILDLTWEDTGRFKNSAVGPNISDLTIQVADDRGNDELKVTCMPVIRFPNYSDRSCDLDPRTIFLLTGNHNGSALKRTSLHDLLVNPRRYLSNPDSWKPSRGRPRSLLAGRDTRVLASAQACFLPIPKSGQATFNPVLFNYQSIHNDPAVLAILATREGTSMTVIDNTRDAFAAGSAWGQRLFFNANGQRASLTGKRESEFSQSPGGAASKLPQASSEAALNMVLLIQVPLKQKSPPRTTLGGLSFGKAPVAMNAMDGLRSSDVENAVIGHGALEGAFTEIDNLLIERDPRFPVRVTVQFYQATSNGVVSNADLQEIKDQIQRVYADSAYVGSLVTDGPTPRVTEHDGPKAQPQGWWQEFWRRRGANHP